MSAVLCFVADLGVEGLYIGAAIGSYFGLCLALWRVSLLDYEAEAKLAHKRVKDQVGTDQAQLDRSGQTGYNSDREDEHENLLN